MHSYKVLLSQLAKALCLSEVVTQAPFPSTEFQGLPSSCVMSACDVLNTRQSHRAGLGTAAPTGETYLPSPPCLSLLPIPPKKK